MAAGADHDTGEGSARAGRIGRRVAVGIYLGVLIYVTAIAFGAVIPQALSPVATPEAQARAPESCGEGMASLEQRLRLRAAVEVGPRDPAAPPPPLDSFFQTWDDDYVALAGRCDGETYSAVGRRRYQLEITLRRYEREDARLAREVERRLADSR